MQISNEFVFSPTTDSSFLLSWSDAIHSCAGKNDDESENDIFPTIIFILGKCEEQGDRAWDEMGEQTYHSEQEAVPWYPKQNTQEDERGKIPLCPEISSITGQNLYRHTHTHENKTFFLLCKLCTDVCHQVALFCSFGMFETNWCPLSSISII